MESSPFIEMLLLARLDVPSGMSVRDVRASRRFRMRAMVAMQLLCDVAWEIGSVSLFAACELDANVCLRRGGLDTEQREFELCNSWSKEEARRRNLRGAPGCPST